MAPARNTMFAKNLTLFRRTKALEQASAEMMEAYKAWSYG